MSLQLPEDRLDGIVARHAAATDEINHASDPVRTVELARELSELDPVVAAIGPGARRGRRWTARRR